MCQQGKRLLTATEKSGEMGGDEKLCSGYNMPILFLSLQKGI